MSMLAAAQLGRYLVQFAIHATQVENDVATLTHEPHVSISVFHSPDLQAILNFQKVMISFHRRPAKGSIFIFVTKSFKDFLVMKK